MDRDSLRAGIGGSGGLDISTQQAHRTYSENQDESQGPTEYYATPGDSFFGTQTIPSPWISQAFDDGSEIAIPNFYNPNHPISGGFQSPGRPHLQPGTSFSENTVTSPFPAAPVHDSRLITSTERPRGPNYEALGGFQPPTRSPNQAAWSFLETDTIASSLSPRVFTGAHPSDQTPLTNPSQPSGIFSHEELNVRNHNNSLPTDDFYPYPTLEQSTLSGLAQTPAVHAPIQGQDGHEINSVPLDLEDSVGNLPGDDHPMAAQDIEAFLSLFRRLRCNPEPWEIIPLSWLTRKPEADIKAWFEQHRDDPLPSAVLTYTEESSDSSDTGVAERECPGRSDKKCKTGGKHVCPHCGGSFTKKQDRKRHLETYNPPKWWHCPYCPDFKLSRKDKFRSHMRRLHVFNSISLEQFATPNDQKFPEVCGDCGRKSRTWVEWYKHLDTPEHKNVFDTVMRESSSFWGGSSVTPSRSLNPMDTFNHTRDHFEELRATGTGPDRATRRSSLQRVVRRFSPRRSRRTRQ